MCRAKIIELKKNISIEKKGYGVSINETKSVYANVDLLSSLLNTSANQTEFYTENTKAPHL